MVPIYNGILLNNNRNKIRPFAATSMDLEIIILSEVRQRQIYDTISMWNLIKMIQKKLIYKTDSKILKPNLWLPKGKSSEKG